MATEAARLSTNAPAATLVPPVPGGAQAVIQQIVQVTGQLGLTPVELSLSPEELGRVRMTLSPAENGMVLSIVAEREETLALLRRNLDSLTQDLRDLGFETLTFQFGSGGPGADRDQPPDQSAHVSGAGEPTNGADGRSDARPSLRMNGDRLDLRL